MLASPNDLAAEHSLRSSSALLFRLADDHAFARCQPICFHHNGRMKMRQCFRKLSGGTADRIMRSRDIVSLHKFLGECLAAFEHCRLPRGAKDAHAAAFHFIHQPQT